MPQQPASPMTPTQELALLRQQHDALLRAIAHDLRAPLRHLQSFAPLLAEAVQTLAQGAAPQQQEAAADALEFGRYMQEAAQRMAQMVEALTTLSRAARQPLQLQTVDLLATCQAQWQTLQAQYPQAQLQWPNASNTAITLQADPQALGQLIHALLDNAGKFSAPQARPHIQLNAHQQGGQWHISLHDNGVGFEPNQAAAQLGQPFTRMHRDSEFPGLGCGLALAQTLALRQGAQLAISAQPGLGCVVTLDWPGASACPAAE